MKNLEVVGFENLTEEEMLLTDGEFIFDLAIAATVVGGAFGYINTGTVNGAVAGATTGLVGATTGPMGILLGPIAGTLVSAVEVN